MKLSTVFLSIMAFATITKADYLNIRTEITSLKEMLDKGTFDGQISYQYQCSSFRVSRVNSSVPWTQMTSVITGINTYQSSSDGLTVYGSSAEENQMSNYSEITTYTDDNTANVKYAEEVVSKDFDGQFLKKANTGERILKFENGKVVTTKYIVNGVEKPYNYEKYNVNYDGLGFKYSTTTVTVNPQPHLDDKGNIVEEVARAYTICTQQMQGYEKLEDLYPKVILGTWTLEMDQPIFKSLTFDKNGYVTVIRGGYREVWHYRIVDSTLEISNFQGPSKFPSFEFSTYKLEFSSYKNLSLIPLNPASPQDNWVLKKIPSQIW